MDAPRQFPMKWYWITLVAIVVFSVLPYGFFMVADAIASPNGCILGGLATPCIIWGMDWADLLYALREVSWLIFYTFPAACILLFVWLIALIVHSVLWQRKETA